MRIEPIAFERVDGLPRWSAKIVYENRQLEAPPLTIASDALDGSRPPLAFFLLAMLPGALAGGERRVQVVGDLDRTLAENIGMAVSLLSYWFFKDRPIPLVEATGRLDYTLPRGPGVGMPLSGGLDSLALLNRLGKWFPSGHPAALTDAFFAEGFDISIPGQEVQSDLFRRAHDTLRPVCERRGVRLHAVHTNLRHPHLALGSWPDAHFGLATAGMGHALAQRIRELHIAGMVAASDLFPHGSHPLIEPQCSSGELRVHHAMADCGRLGRARSIGQEPDLVAVLRVCWAGIRNDGPLNCGKCHKCVVTMLELLVAGVARECPTLPHHAVSADLIMQGVRENTASSLPHLKELLDPLDAIGRQDLTSAVRYKIECIEKHVQQAQAMAAEAPKPQKRRWWMFFR